MDTFNLLIIIFVLLVGAVIFVVNIQRKEHKKAEQFHQASKFKYRANESANILSNFAKIPIGEETRKILLQVIQKNLTYALKIQPQDKYVRERLPAVNKQLSNTNNKIDSGQLTLPADPQQLNKLLNSLTKLSSYIIKISKVNKLDMPLTKISIGKLSSLITETKLSAYIQQIKKGLATENYDFAVKQLVTTKQLIAALKTKSNRIIALQERLAKLEQEVKISYQKAKQNKKIQQEKISRKEPSEDVDTVFGPKKKW
ncbi:MAG: hypothetical protein COB38_00245 [Gammaproteobacteria bacterium]|nr:MAG: hypothetical protein COB38_00245 [Gammaproteobacteria bacterium]